jgi:hypothetical protein
MLVPNETLTDRDHVTAALLPGRRFRLRMRPPAAACAYVSSAAVVFVGKVVFTNDDQSGTFVQKTLVRFEVEEAFKGLPPGADDVWIDPGSFTSCYAEYNVGERWLIFAYNGFRMPAGATHLSLLEGFTYNLEAKIWVGRKGNQEVARSGPTQWITPSGPNRLTLVLTQRSKQYN